jgi:hypothetical protein
LLSVWADNRPHPLIAVSTTNTCPVPLIASLSLPRSRLDPSIIVCCFGSVSTTNSRSAGARTILVTCILLSSLMASSRRSGCRGDGERGTRADRSAGHPGSLRVGQR